MKCSILYGVWVGDHRAGFGWLSECGRIGNGGRLGGGKAGCRVEQLWTGCGSQSQKCIFWACFLQKFKFWANKNFKGTKAPLRCSLNQISQNYPKTMTANVKWGNLKVHPRLLEKFVKRGRGRKDYSAQPFPVLICTGAHFPIHWRALAVVTGVRTQPTHPPESV